ncbi:MAG: DUF3180 domain-containing protein [Aeromicrobium sp.]|uniref:DUF3180 domain-containing protein n=1 Tax=Aeromicrobium sp. TaxID=1871063 RepID=UPI0039E3F833
MNAVRPTSARLLAVLLCAGLIVGAVFPAVVRRWGGFVPTLSWTPAVVLGGTAVIVGAVAWGVWRAVHREQLRVNADRAITHLALGRASSRAGSLFAGLYGGFALAYVDVVETANGRDRVVHGAGAVVGAALLVAAGLLLERACRLPAGDDEDDDPSDAEPTPA